MYFSAFDCQTRWTRLHERYSREKKLRDIKTRSGSESKIRSSFPLYEIISNEFFIQICQE